MRKVAVYPGSFDPITKGHINIIERVCKLFDQVIVLIAENPQKKTTFTVSEREAMIATIFQSFPNVKVDHTSGLTLDYVRENNADVLVRGLRAATDFEYEFQIMSANRIIAPEIETIFLMTSNEYTFVSSSIVKEIFFGGADVSTLVPKVVIDALAKKKR